MAKRRRGQKQYRLAARRYRAAGKRGQRSQEQQWARMAGPVTVRRFDPQTGEAIAE